MNKPYFIELKGQLEHGGIKSKSDWAIVGNVNIPKLVEDVESLSDENKRLREALVKITNHRVNHFLTRDKMVESMFNVAKEVLEGDKHD